MNKDEITNKRNHGANYFNYTVSIREAILLFFITLVVGQLVGAVISIPMYSMPSLSHVLLPLSFLLGFGAAAFIIMILKQLRIKEIQEFLHIKAKLLHVVLGIGLYLVSLPLAEYLAMLVPTEGIPILEELYKLFESGFQMIFDYKIAAFIMVCILAPILEEFIFRGLILRGMLNKGINPWFAIIFSAFLFGAAHMNPWQFLGAGFIGAILGFIYWRTQSLLLVIFLHFLNNAIAFAVTLETNSLEESVFEPEFMILSMAFILTLVIGYFFYQKTNSTSLKPIDS